MSLGNLNTMLSSWKLKDAQAKLENKEIKH